MTIGSVFAFGLTGVIFRQGLEHTSNLTAVRVDFLVLELAIHNAVKSLEFASFGRCGRHIDIRLRYIYHFALV